MVTVLGEEKNLYTDCVASSIGREGFGKYFLIPETLGV